MAFDDSFGNQDIAGQTGDGVVIGGATYMIATDWGSAGGTGFTAAHVQVVKPAWGDTDNTYRVSTLNPMPVQLWDPPANMHTGRGATVSRGALSITGGVALGHDIHCNKLPVNVRDTGTEGGAVVGSRTVTSIIQVVGPTLGVCGPTAYGPNAGGAVTDDYFAPIRVTGSVKGQLADGRFGVTFDQADIRKLYGGPIGWVGFGGTYSGYTAHGGTTDYDATTGNEPYPLKDIDWMMIQGMSGGTPVGVTAQSSAGLLTRRLRSRYAVGDYGNAASDTKDSIAVEGFAGMTALSVTGGIRIESQPNGGSFEIRNLVYSRDSVAIAGNDGTTGAHVKVFGSNGDPIGVSAGALKVAVDNGAFDITANVGVEVEVKGSTGTSGLQVRGITHNEVAVRGMLSGGAIEVASPSGLNIRNLNANDLVSLGGVAGSDLTTIKNAANNISSKASTISSNTNQIAWQNLQLQQSFTQSPETGKGYKSYEDQLSGVTFGLAVNVIANKQPTQMFTVSQRATTTLRPMGTGVPITSGVTIQANPNNTDYVIITADPLNPDGLFLAAGESIFLQVDQLSKIYVRANRNIQTVIAIGS